MMSEHWSFTFTDFSLSRHSPMRVTTMSRGVASPRPRPAGRRRGVRAWAGRMLSADTADLHTRTIALILDAQWRTRAATRHARALVLMRLMRVHAIFATS